MTWKLAVQYTRFFYSKLYINNMTYEIVLRILSDIIYVPYIRKYFLTDI